MSWLRAFMFLACLAAAPGLAHGQQEGISPSGHKGTLHVVQTGDTLWDITARYLGTPWIWPSIWKENDAIDNPHIIQPGDLIWITEGEMRKVTPEEAEALLRGMAEPEPEPEPEQALEPRAKPDDPFAALDGEDLRPEHFVRYAGLDTAPFVGSDEIEALGSVLGSHEEHYWLVQDQRMIVSLGEGEGQVGEVYAVFRPRRKIYHPETNEIVGYYIEVIGRVELTEVHPESSYAMVRWSSSEIEPGDRLMPELEEPDEVAPAFLADPVEGLILAHQPNRLYAGAGDLVMLDRGADHGVIRGAEFLVYREGGLRLDSLEQKSVEIPDDVIGRMFVLKSTSRSSVALVMRSRTEVEPGDRYRTP